jgi:hypothetical protein
VAVRFVNAGQEYRFKLGHGIQVVDGCQIVGQVLIENQLILFQSINQFAR